MMEVLYLTFVGHIKVNTTTTTTDTEPVIERHKKRYVLLISNSLDNATRLLMPYRANLEQNKRLIQDERVENVMLTVRDGMQLVRKK